MSIKSIKSGYRGISLQAGNILTPTPGYRLWLDAADTSTISVSGNAVTQWTDKSANAYAFTQGTAGSRPSSGTRTVNGRNVIDFDGTDDALGSTATASTWTFMHNTSGTTWFVVVLPDVTNVGQFVMETNGGFGDQRGFWHLITSGGNHDFRITSTAAVSLVTDAATSGSAVLYTVKSDPGNGTLADRLKFYKNNGSASGTNTSNATASSSDPYETLQLGKAIIGGLPLNGAICEILLYPSLLSDADREKTREYLMIKWGL